MRKSLLLWIGAGIISLVCVGLSYAQTGESITISTYYPSPYGVYKNLRIFPNDDNTPGAACSYEGETYYDASEQTVYICSGSPTIWQPSSVPRQAVMSFNLTNCPPGWSPLAAAQGRYIVGVQPGGTLGGMQGSALSNMEDRPVGSHTHTYNTWVSSGQTRGPGGAGHTLWPTGSTTGATGAVGGTNAPYIQLMMCQKD
jgi:hypothetical protein